MKKRGTSYAANSGDTKGDRWFLTYSDMITLLLALFIVLYSSSSINEKKLEQITKNMHVALNNTSYGTGTGTGTGTGNGTGDGTGTAEGTLGYYAISKNDFDTLYQDLKDYVATNHLQDQIDLENTSNYVQIRLKDTIMFEPNSPTMLPSSQPILQKLEMVIAKVYDRVDHITISGHTADVVVHSTQSDQISWKLSTDRAVTVLNSLIGYGLKEEKLSIQGYAHFVPIASNDTEDGRSQNRRVEITIYKNPPEEDDAEG